MPTNRTPIRRQRRLLSWSEEMSLEWGEADHRGVGFTTEQERRTAWERHRDYLMAKCDHGFRPQAWWDYDAPKLGVRRPRDPEYDKAALWEAGLLFEDEATTLEAHWREHFDRAQEPDFRFCIGHDSKRHCAVWVQGAEARRAHYRWAGIPRTLIKQWTKQRTKTIRKLAKAAPQQPPTSTRPAPPSTPPETPPRVS